MPESIGERRLQRRYGTVSRARSFYTHQMLDHLNNCMQDFVARMEMVFIATADGSGAADCSFRAGPPGFVRVLDQRRLVYPEYRGNGVMSSLGNISENGHIGLLFIDFCGDAIGLHVNGVATVVENAELAGDRLTVDVLDGLLQEGGRRPERWVRVDVEEAYIHRSKHIPKLSKRSEVRQDGGIDDVVRKNGDYFKTKHSPHPGVDGSTDEPVARLSG